MNASLAPALLGLLGFCIVTEIARELSFKRAALSAQEKPSYVGALALHPLIWVGIAFWAVEVVAWILVLEHAALSLAYPIMTLTYAGVPLASAALLRERLSRVQIMGAALIAIGVSCVSLSGL